MGLGFVTRERRVSVRGRTRYMYDACQLARRVYAEGAHARRPNPDTMQTEGAMR